MKKISTKQLQKFKNMSANDLRSLSRNQAQDLLRQMREAWRQRAEQLGRQGGNFYSPSYEKMKKYYADKKTVAPSRTRKDSAVAELSRLNQFFNAETATVKGARDVMRKQDLRIFGEGENAFGKPTGKPAKRMKRDQREMFWAAYNEFSQGADTAALAARSYQKIQSALGLIVRSTRKKNLSLDNLTSRLKAVLTQLEDIEAGESIENADPIAKLLSGTGDDFHR